jgi:23S rRNA (cytidine1920-2'-O)/16S rRNA (cytidine1409-2'-O)-methyltransferase
MSTKTRTRLDALLVRRGLFESRSRAASSVLAGQVRLGTKAEPAAKPGKMVPEDIEIALEEEPRFVSRGGLKLERALDCFGIDVASRRCLDVGASTGGFTDCLLQRGAAAVTAVDVAYGQLDWKLRSDERVTVVERLNARDLTPGELSYRPDLITVDLSFIGLAKVLPALSRCTASRFDLLALVKPQFEIGRERVGRGGVVRGASDRLETLVAVGNAALRLGFSVHGFCSSGLPGPAGNRESFILCREGERPGVEDLIAAALEAEPDAVPKGGTR